MSRAFFHPSALLPLCAAAPLVAQSITAGGLQGQVLQRGLRTPVASATLRLRNPETGWTRTLTAEPGGRFRFVLVPVGLYELTVLAPGHLSRRVRGLRVSLGAVRDLELLLDPAGESAVVEVLGVSSEVDVVQTSPVARFTLEALEALPLESRNLSDLLKASPGAGAPEPGLVSVDGARASQNQVLVDGMAATSAYSGFPLGVLSSSFLFSLGTIQEVQVLNQAFDVQFGEALGGVVNALTRSGTNAFRGQLLLKLRPESLTARMHPVDRDPYGLTNRPEALDRGASARTWNAVFSGPLVKDRAHFLVGFEQQVEAEQYSPGLPLMEAPGLRPSDLEAWRRALGDRLVTGAGGQTWSQEVLGQHPTQTRMEAWFAKLDLRMDAAHSLNFRVNGTRWRGDQGAGGVFSAPSNTVAQTDTANTALLEFQSLLGSLVHELRLQWAEERYAVTAPQGLGPELVIAGLAAGQSSFAPERFRERILQVGELATFVRGPLLFKAGVDFKAIECRDDDLSYRLGSLEFPSYAGAVAWAQGGAGKAEPVSYVQSYRLGGETERIREWLGALYCQLHLHEFPLKGLDLQLGVRATRQRWDAPALPNPDLAGLDTPADARSLDPRISFVWHPRGAWTLRGGIGSFSSPNLGALGLRSRTLNGRVAGRLEVSGETADPIFASGLLSVDQRLQGNRLQALDPAQVQEALRVLGGQPLNLWDPTGRMPQAWKAALELQWEPGNSTEVRLRWAQTRSRNLAYWINVNLAQCDPGGVPIPGAVYRDGYPSPSNHFSRVSAERPGHAFIRGRRVDFSGAGDVYLSTQQGGAFSRSLSLSVLRRVETGFGVQGHLTWATAWDQNTNEHGAEPGIRAVIMTPADPGASWAPSDYDVRWRLHLTATYAAAGGFRGALTVHYASPRPATAREGVDLNGDGLYNDPAPGFGGRNGYRLREYRNLDLRLAQRLPGSWGGGKAEAFLEASNLMNWDNARPTSLVATYQGYAVPSFGSTTLPDPRTRSLALGLQFTW